MVMMARQVTRGMVVAPHHLAAEAGLSVLREGGNAIEAMLAAAATIAVVYPHMNSIGGDGFWMIHRPGEEMIAIDACGPAAGQATIARYREKGLDAIPFRGGDAAITVAGTVAGWELAQDFSQSRWGGRLPVARLLEDAIHHAEAGCPVTPSQAVTTREKASELAPQPGFGEVFLPEGKPPEPGTLFRQPRLAGALRQLARAGYGDFYCGDLAADIARDLERAGSPVRRDDLASQAATLTAPLSIQLRIGKVFNTPPPTQGLASLIILGLLERFGIDRLSPESPECVHAVVEATKLAFRVRDAVITDPAFADHDLQDLLGAAHLENLAEGFNPAAARPWPSTDVPGDTVWLGAVDGEGRAVSFIQSIYHEFGSGVVLPSSGICWQNRGCSFSLDEAAMNPLTPQRKPFHTLNPPIALLRDGRTLAYGTMGGDGQPQTQAAIFVRHVFHGQDLAHAIDAPRWLLGRTWGRNTDTLKLESRFSAALCDRLVDMGHQIETLEDYSEMVGHAGAVAVGRDGIIFGAWDPRSDGNAAGF